MPCSCFICYTVSHNGLLSLLSEINLSPCREKVRSVLKQLRINTRQSADNYLINQSKLR